jgi:Family of unknown function (DUF6348)
MVRDAATPQSSTATIWTTFTTDTGTRPTKATTTSTDSLVARRLGTFAREPVVYAPAMIWQRTRSSNSPERPSNDEILELLRDALREIAPQLVDGCEIRNGLMAGPQGWGLAALPNHTDDPWHFDVGFILWPQPAVVPDCINGIGPPREAAAWMARIWRETSGACLAEMLTRRGEYASHVDGSDSAGLPGWHLVVSKVFAYGPDPASNHALQAVLVERDVLREIAPQLVPALDRPAHNGIKVFCQRSPTSASAEVRVNGERHEAASRALAALPWPEVTAPAVARFYAVAVRPG